MPVLDTSHLILHFPATPSLLPHGRLPVASGTVARDATPVVLTHFPLVIAGRRLRLCSFSAGLLWFLLLFVAGGRARALAPLQGAHARISQKMHVCLRRGACVV